MADLKKQLQRILNTSNDISWDVIKEKGNKGTIRVKKDFKPLKTLTDMDIDMAMNDPSRHNRGRESFGQKVRMEIETDNKFNIIKSKILKRGRC